jgi:hypothetical protein
MKENTYEAYGVFAIRPRGDVPKLAKLMGDRVHHDISSARIEASVLEMELETPMDVRRLVVEVMESIDPTRPPDVPSS